MRKRDKRDVTGWNNSARRVRLVGRGLALSYWQRNKVSQKSIFQNQAFHRCCPRSERPWAQPEHDLSAIQLGTATRRAWQSRPLILQLDFEGAKQSGHVWQQTFCDLQFTGTCCVVLCRVGIPEICLHITHAPPFPRVASQRPLPTQGGWVGNDLGSGAAFRDSDFLHLQESISL